GFADKIVCYGKADSPGCLTTRARWSERGLNAEGRVDVLANAGHDRREVVPGGECLDEVGAARVIGSPEGRAKLLRAPDPLGLGAKRTGQGGIVPVPAVVVTPRLVDRLEH